MNQDSLINSLEQMTKNFLNCEMKLLQESSLEFRVLLQNTLKEVIEDLFLQEISTLTNIKKEIAKRGIELQQKQRLFTSNIDLLLEEMVNYEQGINGDFSHELENLRLEIKEKLLEGQKNKKTMKKDTLILLSPDKTPKEKGFSFFTQRPRAANIIFMEKRLKEMFPSGISAEKMKGPLTGLLEEWKMLDYEGKKEYEIQAEREFIEHLSL